MTIEIRVPALGESVTEATVGKWFKSAGEAVNVDEPLCELETDKVTVEVPAPAAGVLSEIKVPEGTTVAVGAVLGSINEGAGAAPRPAAKTEPLPAKAERAAVSAEQKPAPAAPRASIPEPQHDARAKAGGDGGMPPSPSARKLMEEKGLSPENVPGSGRRGQILKGDVQDAAARPASQPQASTAIAHAATTPAPMQAQQLRAPSAPNDAAREERVKMTRLRQTIARRLKDAQNTAAVPLVLGGSCQ